MKPIFNACGFCGSITEHFPKERGCPNCGKPPTIHYACATKADVVRHYQQQYDTASTILNANKGETNEPQTTS